MSKTQLLIVIVALAAPAALAAALAVQHTTSDRVPVDRAGAPTLAISHAGHVPGDAANAAREAARVVMSKKAAFAAACWTPLQSSQPVPAQSRHRVRETFDAEGNEVSRTVEDVPGQSRADVAECLRALPLDLEIAGGNKPTTVAVTIAFP